MFKFILYLCLICISKCYDGPEPEVRGASFVLDEANFDFVRDSEHPFVIVFFKGKLKCPTCGKMVTLIDNMSYM